MTDQAVGSTTGAEAIDYHKVMGLEAQRQRWGISNTRRSCIVRIGAKPIPQADLNQMLLAAGLAPRKEKEIAFYYGCGH